ncbi:non-homologous end-joining DNA ligase [Salsipaludibacter albus]|uniref:non-homologous end-joining DNA ligase n=1 Tax=Salsipaludibacter albus TaxID=2849650 RepID=UPI001EE408CF|nr:non-homologous end-joining DNA ligase [Salsipaludibacter albus]MBY5161410.1 non-homologous end-joining DNA ligase [Salsipaludibacter albus]
MAQPRLSSPDKVLWPASGHTKQDLWDYVHTMADRLVPQLRHRPLSVKRFPRGVGEQGFFQKNLPDHAPAGIRRWRQWADSADREVAYALVDDVEDLAWFAQQNTIEFHPSIVRIDRPDRPDQLVLDLDPGERDTPIGRTARWVHDVLDELGLPSLVKTSGGRGLHVLVPIERRQGAEVLRPLTLAIARMVADRHTDDLTVEMRKAGRDGRTLLDWSRSTPGATLIAAWSPRAHPLATVATPLDWAEVGDDLDPTRFTIDTAPDRLDPWAELDHPPARLGPVRTAVEDAGYPLVDASPRATTAGYLDG